MLKCMHFVLLCMQFFGCMRRFLQPRFFARGYLGRASLELPPGKITKKSRPVTSRC